MLSQAFTRALIFLSLTFSILSVVLSDVASTPVGNMRLDDFENKTLLALRVLLCGSWSLGILFTASIDVPDDLVSFVPIEMLRLLSPTVGDLCNVDMAGVE